MRGKPRERWRSVLVLAGFATAGFGLGTLQTMPAGARRPAAMPAFWVSDRGAHEVVGLDRDLVPVRRFALASPVEVEPAQGGLWVLSARESGPLGPHDLFRVDYRGTPLARAAFEAVVDLATLDGGDALLVEWRVAGAREDRALRVGPTGEVRELASGLGFSCVAGRGPRVVVGTESGEVLAFPADGSGSLLAQRFLGVQITDLAPSPHPGTWWALEAGGGSRLFLLDDDLETSWEVATFLRALHLVPVLRGRGTGGVWLADSTEPLVRRYGLEGELEIERGDLPLSGLDRGLALASGGVLFCAPGALVHVGPDGSLQPGQGGFRFLVDVTAP